MEDNTEIKRYIDKNKELNNILINFLDSSNNTDDDDENYFNQLTKYIKTEKYIDNKNEFVRFLQLIMSLFDNHHRNKCFFNKIEQIIQYFANDIKSTFSNYEIFNILKGNKYILLYLIKSKLIILDESIYSEIIAAYEPNGIKLWYYLFPEIKSFIGDQEIESIEKEILSIDPKFFDNFEKKRNEGENSTYIASLIREDSVEEFVSYINKNSISPTGQIKPSIFETNRFLNEKESYSFIEYAFFYGSIKIIQYLHSNGVEFTSKLWLYGIHSNDAEIISYLEENNVTRDEEILSESIKCHHNELTNYFISNYELKIDKQTFSNISKYNNYSYFPTKLGNKYEFFYLFIYHHEEFVNLFIKNREKKILKEVKLLIDPLKKSVDENDTEFMYFSLIKSTSIFDVTFADMKSVQFIVFPPSINSINQKSFYEFDCLKQVYIPSSVKEIGDYAFYGCLNLIEVTFEKSSSLKSIGDFAFMNCSSLKEILIPSSIESIGCSSFYYCKNLKKIVFEIPSSLSKVKMFPFFNYNDLVSMSLPIKIEKKMIVGIGPFDIVYLAQNITKKDVCLPYDMTIEKLKEFCLDLIQFDNTLVDKSQILYKSKILDKNQLFSYHCIPPYSKIEFYIPSKYTNSIND